jgi:hypothetical protein
MWVTMTETKPIDVAGATPAPVPTPPPTASAQAFFEFVSQHVVLATTLLFLLGMVASTAALAAYLRVFDWHLIWLIEYPDVIRWGLVTIAFVSAFALMGWTMIDDAITWVTSYKPVIGFVIIWAVSLAGWLARDYFSADPHYSLTFFMHLAAAALTLTAVNIAQTARLYPNFTVRHVIGDVFFVVFTAGIIGSMIGYMVRDGWGFQHHVVARTTPDLRSVGLVMITSQFVVLWDRDHTVVLPVADVTRIEGQPRPGSH